MDFRRSDTWEKVQQRQSDNRSVTGLQKARQKYLLSGLVICGHCGSSMHANRRKKECQLTFRCTRKVQNMDCNAKEINMHNLEKYVIDMLKSNIFSIRKVNDVLDILDNTDTSADTGNHSAEITKELENIQQTRANILKAVENGFMAEDIADRLNSLRNQEKSLRERLNAISSKKSLNITKKEVLLLINRFNQAVKEDDQMELRRIMLGFVDSVIVKDGKIDLNLKLSFGDAISIDCKIPAQSGDNTKDAL